MSTSSVFWPSRARQAARLMLVVVFPQPPFWLMIAMIRMTNLPWLVPRSGLECHANTALVVAGMFRGQSVGRRTEKLHPGRNGPLPSIEIDVGASQTLTLWGVARGGGFRRPRSPPA